MSSQEPRKLRVYNTLTRSKVDFEPRDPGRVSMYVCGVTPYDSLHVGHARTFLAYDTIRRYLEFAGYQTHHLQNVTDVDDKIINRARERGEDPLALAVRYAEEAVAGCDALGLLRAHLYPKVTEHIPEILEVVRGLIEKHAAYPANGDVYFDVSAFVEYGKLSKRSVDELLAGARVEPGELKEDPMDFALWKAAKEGEPSWQSPWGPGRPGWHIECTAMALKHLGNGFDIHGGALELLFPHHENELAQSEAYTGEAPFVRHWLHSGVVTIRGEKMAKSTGNFVLLRDALSESSPDALRMLFLTTHYRNPLDYSQEKVEQAEAAIERIATALVHLRRAAKEMGASAATDLPVARQHWEKFLAAMDDDFNTPEAIGAMFGLVSEANRSLAAGEASSAHAATLLSTLTHMLAVLGFSPAVAEPCVDSGMTSALLDLVVDVRQKARARKLWDFADEIRDRLAELGVALEDGPEGTTWRRR